MNNFLDIFKSFINYINHPIVTLGGQQISTASILIAVVIMFVSYKLAALTEVFVTKALNERNFDSGVKASTSRVSKYVVVVVGILIALDTVGISLSSLAAIGAVFMVGIGFGLQNIAQNFIAGLIILFERPIKTGDVVSVGGTRGVVRDIRVRATVIRTLDDVAIIVPNSQFISEQVVNESHLSAHIRIAIDVGVAYGTPPELVKSALLNAAKQHREVLSHPEPDVWFESFGDSSLNFKLLCWVENIVYKDKVRSDLMFLIEKELNENDIVIPFPQRVVHFANSISDPKNIP